MPVIDRSARDRAARLIEGFVACLMTNDEFDERYPLKSKDRALFAVFWQVWRFYDDLREHRLEGRYSLHSDGRAFLERCVCFLRSDLPYRWPPLWSVPVLGRVIALIGPAYEVGDTHTWPFQRRSEFEAHSSP